MIVILLQQTKVTIRYIYVDWKMMNWLMLLQVWIQVVKKKNHITLFVLIWSKTNTKWESLMRNFWYWQHVLFNVYICTWYVYCIICYKLYLCITCNTIDKDKGRKMFVEFKSLWIGMWFFFFITCIHICSNIINPFTISKQTNEYKC